MADAMRPEWRMLVMLAAYTTLRFGELSELRRTRRGPRGREC